MRPRRHELGLSRVDPERGVVEVYVRDARGNVWLREFQKPADDALLEDAETEWLAEPESWRFDPAPGEAAGVDLVWERGSARLYVASEAGVTATSLATHDIDLVVSLNEVADATRDEVRAHLALRDGAVHLDVPVRDAEARHQAAGDAERAALALAAVTDALARGRHVLVHCLLGEHRSPALAAAALSELRAFPGPREAFLAVHAARPLAAWYPDTVAWMLSLQPAAR